MHYAAKYRADELIGVIIKKGVRLLAPIAMVQRMQELPLSSGRNGISAVNAINNDGDTALHLVIKQGRIQATSDLLNCGYLPHVCF